MEWPSVAYMPGELSARGYVGGKVVKTSVVRTTGSPVALRMGIIDGVGAEGIVANGQDVGLVFVEVVDDKGDVVPTASNLITVSTQSGAFRKQGIPKIAIIGSEEMFKVLFKVLFSKPWLKLSELKTITCSTMHRL